MSRLTDPWFEAHFYGDATSTSTQHLDSIEGAQGVWLCCPCRGGHSVQVPFANPRNAPQLPPDHGPLSRDGTTHPRWTMSGTSLDDLTVTPSIDVGTTSCWHCFITAGEVTP